MSSKEEQIEKTQKSIILVLILGIIAIGLLGFYAFSKYITSVQGTGEAQVARWSFKLKDMNGTSTSEGPITFAITRTDKYGNVAENKLAPGTFGQFEIIVDSKGTEVGYRYDIEFEVENCPTNLLFYSDSGRTTKIGKTEGTKNKTSGEGTGTQATETIKVATFKVSKYVPLEKANGEFSEMIYWDWPYETTGTMDQSIYDGYDTADEGKTVTMNIKVTGTQVLDNDDDLNEATEKIPTLAELIDGNKIHVGDYVNYKAVKDEDVEALESYNPTTEADNTNETLKKYVYITDIEKTGAPSIQTFKATNMKWRVLSVDKDTIKIMGEPTTEQLSLGKLYDYNKCITGFINAEDVLNKIGAIYGNGKGAQKGDSINVDDINKIANYNPENDASDYGKEYELTRAAEFVKQKDGDMTDFEVGSVRELPAIMKKTFYQYQSERIIDAKIRKMIFGENDDKKFWIKSRSVSLGGDSYYGWVASYGIRIIEKGYLTMCSLFHSEVGYPSDGEYPVCPVITLKSDAQMKKDSNGVWDLIVD